MSNNPVIRARLRSGIRCCVTITRRSGTSQTYWGVTHPSARRLCAVITGAGGIVIPFTSGWSWSHKEEEA